ncbi:MAG TPA: RIO1 family regulatory kinase/ATPase [Candidatus Limnocylindria bacterium]
MHPAVPRSHLGRVRRAEAGLARQDRRHVRREGIAQQEELIAHGRDADVYAAGDGRVLRRFRTHDVSAHELLAMRVARAHGYPVPEVFSATGRDLVMQRIDAPTMLEVLERDLTELDRHARLLAALHERLHVIGAPAELRAIGPGNALLHLDLHPANVLLAPDGPYVIDWTNAARGHWADDVAQTVTILWSAKADREHTGIVEHFVEVFLRAFDRDAVRAHLAEAVARRIADANLTEAERAAVRDLRL